MFPPEPPSIAVKHASTMTSLLLAMARMEGWGKPDNRLTRDMNPGGIEYGKFARAHGAIGSDGRFAIFPDAQTGFRAMAELLRSAYHGMTVEQALMKYAPPRRKRHDPNGPLENDTRQYIENMLKWSGAKPTDIIDNHLPPTTTLR